MSGRAVEDLETPAVVIDLDRLEANVGRMAESARRSGVRPHFAVRHGRVEAEWPVAARGRVT